MELARVAVVQLDLRDGDYKYNFDKLARAVSYFAPRHDLIVLPKTVTTGFASQADVKPHAEPLDGPTVTHLMRWSGEYATTIVCGIAKHAADALYNSAVIVSRGELLFTHRKVQLWPDELTLFKAGDVLQTAPWHGTRLGALICFDIEFPEPARALAAMGGGSACSLRRQHGPFWPAAEVAGHLPGQSKITCSCCWQTELAPEESIALPAAASLSPLAAGLSAKPAARPKRSFLPPSTSARSMVHEVDSTISL